MRLHSQGAEAEHNIPDEDALIDVGSMSKSNAISSNMVRAGAESCVSAGSSSREMNEAADQMRSDAAALAAAAAGKWACAHGWSCFAATLLQLPVTYGLTSHSLLLLWMLNVFPHWIELGLFVVCLHRSTIGISSGPNHFHKFSSSITCFLGIVVSFSLLLQYHSTSCSSLFL